ncbi:hypothetical protein SMACR_09832, partial [Sordaria macrospora]
MLRGIESLQSGRDPLDLDEEELKHLVNERLPRRYDSYRDVFGKIASDTLPGKREDIDHKIILEDGRRPEELGYNRLYKMTLEELKEYRKYITDNLQTGFIATNFAPWAAPVLFVAKKEHYPLSLLEETLARIGKAKIVTKIDIRQAFHRIRMDPDSEDLTTFRTRNGAYKYKVLPFGRSNGPSLFQRFINDTLMGYIDVFCNAYIDDILIYSDNEVDHEIHVRKVLDWLREAGLQADIKKCEFHVTETKFLDFIIGVDGVRVDPDKVAAVKDWKEPTTVKGVHAFLGFCNFYRKFIREFGRVARPLHKLTCKDLSSFQWTEDCQRSFDELKDRLLEAPVLAYFSYE